MSACKRSVLLRFRHDAEHTRLCYEHRVAQSHLTGISFPYQHAYLTVCGFEPTSGHPTANVTCPRGDCTPDACMRIDFLSQKSMRGWLREPQASQYTTIANWHLELSKWWEMWYHQITINIVIYIICIDIYIRCFRWGVRLGMLWLAWWTLHFLNFFTACRQTFQF